MAAARLTIRLVRTASSLPGGLSPAVERVAGFLMDIGHDPGPAAAMAHRTFANGDKLPPAVRRYKHLRMTPHEREQFAGALQARRVLVEGLLLTLSGRSVTDGAVLSAHALCEARAVRKPVSLKIGGGSASQEQIASARARLKAERDELDKLVEQAIGSDEPLSQETAGGAKPNPRVVHLQNRLNSMGYRVQSDGRFGPITTEAVKDYQARTGLDATGTVDAQTAHVLRSGARIQHMGAPGQAGHAGQMPGQGMANGAQAMGMGQSPSVNAGEQSGAKQPGEPKAKGRKVTFALDLGEADVLRVQRRLADAKALREEAVRTGSGMLIKVANARIDLLQALLDEAAKSREGVQESRELREDWKKWDEARGRHVGVGIRPGLPDWNAGGSKSSSGDWVDTHDGRKISMDAARREQTDYHEGHGKPSPFIPGHIKRYTTDDDPFRKPGMASPGTGGLPWEKAPGGKRYEASVGQHQYRLVKQNTAAGGPRWKGYHHRPDGSVKIVHKGDDFKAAKTAVEAHAAGHSVKEADVKADFPQSCAVCGGPVRANGMCQRGHSPRKLMHATEEQMLREGLIEESIGPINKGAFHRWLGKSEDEPITEDDIARGLAAGGHPAKMAAFAKSARKWGK